MKKFDSTLFRGERSRERTRWSGINLRQGSRRIRRAENSTRIILGNADERGWQKAAKKFMSPVEGRVGVTLFWWVIKRRNCHVKELMSAAVARTYLLAGVRESMPRAGGATGLRRGRCTIRNEIPFVGLVPGSTGTLSTVDNGSRISVCVRAGCLMF